MKRNALTALSLFVFSTPSLHAHPPTQHSVNGIIRSIDLEKGIVTLEPDKDKPKEFVIVVGRTRLRRDKKPAELSSLTIGYQVHVYYREEMGCFIATEVSWSTSPSPPPPKTK